MRCAARGSPRLVVSVLSAFASLLLLLLLPLAAAPARAFGGGDFVPTARRAQFHGRRTAWHDLLGRHCPRFGAATSAALPLERPESWSEGDTYKLSLSFAHDRLATPWLAVIGPGLDHLPLVDVELTHSAGELRSVKARLYELEDSFPALARHPEVAAHFRNATHWPKHLLVTYRWKEVLEVDALGGAFTLLGVGAMLAAVVMGTVLLEARHQVVRLAEVVSAPGGAEAQSASSTGPRAAAAQAGVRKAD